PEQIRGEPATTATDVYSLSTVLYEMIAGVRPCGRRARSPVEIERAVLEEEPIAPSAARTPRGRTNDLDAIVLMGLRKEPERRYPSVEALVGDLDRHREGLPVSAVRPR